MNHYPMHIIESVKHIIAEEDDKTLQKQLKKNMKGKRNGKKAKR